MAKKLIKLQLDDNPPRVINGRWLRVINDDGDDAVAIINIAHISGIASRNGKSTDCVIEYSDSYAYVKNYTPDQLLKLITDAEFNEALEASLAKGIG